MTDLAQLITASGPVQQQHQANLDLMDQEAATVEADKASEYRAKFPGAPPPTEADYGAMAKDGYDLGTPPYTVPDMYQRPPPIPAQTIIDNARAAEDAQADGDLLDLPPSHAVEDWNYLQNLAGAAGSGVRDAAQEYLDMLDTIGQATGPLPHPSLSGEMTQPDPTEIYLWSQMRGAEAPTLPKVEGYEPGRSVLADVVEPIAQFAAGYALGPARALKGVTQLPRLGEEAIRSMTAASLSFDPEQGNLGTMLRQSESVMGVLNDIGITDEDMKLLDSTEGNAFEQKLKLAVEDGIVGLGLVGGGIGLKALSKTKLAQQVADGLMDVIRNIEGSGDAQAISALRQAGKVSYQTGKKAKVEPPKTVATRAPKPLTEKQVAKGETRTLAADDPSMRTTTKEMQLHPESFAKNVNLFENYVTSFTVDPALPVEQKLAQIVRGLADNLLWLHDAFPAELRDRAKQWYPGANKMAKALAKDHDITPEQAAGMIAVMSPQRDWFKNMDQAKRAMDIYHAGAERNWKATPAMKQWVAEYAARSEKPHLATMLDTKANDPLQKAYWIRAYDETMNDRSYAILSPEGNTLGPALNNDGSESVSAWGSFEVIAKAVRINEDGSLANISAQLGNEHKVRNFYNNIIHPEDPTSVTIDTHAVAAALLRALSGSSDEVTHNFGGKGTKPATMSKEDWAQVKGASGSVETGMSGTYGIYHDAYERAAQERKLTAREMQSITWEAVRGLFEKEAKGAGLDTQVKAIWQQVQDGTLSRGGGLQSIVELSGGITPPSWSTQ